MCERKKLKASGPSLAPVIKKMIISASLNTWAPDLFILRKPSIKPSTSGHDRYKKKGTTPALFKELTGWKSKDTPKVKLHTSLNRNSVAAYWIVSVEGKKPSELDGFLWENYKIHAVGITWENINGLRVTPNVYTTTKNLDRLVEGISEVCTNLDLQL